MADLRLLPQLRIEPVTDEIGAFAGAFDGGMHGDCADRIIAATAHVLGAPLDTVDERLRAVAGITTVW